MAASDMLFGRPNMHVPACSVEHCPAETTAGQAGQPGQAFTWGPYTPCSRPDTLGCCGGPNRAQKTVKSSPKGAIFSDTSWIPGQYMLYMLELLLLEVLRQRSLAYIQSLLHDDNVSHVMLNQTWSHHHKLDIQSRTSPHIERQIPLYVLFSHRLCSDFVMFRHHTLRPIRVGTRCCCSSCLVQRGTIRSSTVLIERCPPGLRLSLPPPVQRPLQGSARAESHHWDSALADGCADTHELCWFPIESASASFAAAACGHRRAIALATIAGLRE